MSRNEERDELAVNLAAAYGDLEVRTPDLHAAAVILEAGYTKPRTIGTVEELRGLTDGTVLMSGNRYPSYAGAIWRVSGGMVVRVGKELEGVIPFRFFVDPLPATVLYEPEAS